MYIDPGSGSMLVQVLIASTVGSVLAFRRSITGFFSRLRLVKDKTKGGKS
jgi:hypothetical protein